MMNEDRDEDYSRCSEDVVFRERYLRRKCSYRQHSRSWRKSMKRYRSHQPLLLILS
jgi:hypothetical protein